MVWAVAALATAAAILIGWAALRRLDRAGDPGVDPQRQTEVPGMSNPAGGIFYTSGYMPPFRADEVIRSVEERVKRPKPKA